MKQIKRFKNKIWNDKNNYRGSIESAEKMTYIPAQKFWQKSGEMDEEVCNEIYNFK